MLTYLPDDCTVVTRSIPASAWAQLPCDVQQISLDGDDALGEVTRHEDSARDVNIDLCDVLPAYLVPHVRLPLTFRTQVHLVLAVECSCKKAQEC